MENGETIGNVRFEVTISALRLLWTRYIPANHGTLIAGDGANGVAFQGRTSPKTEGNISAFVVRDKSSPAQRDTGTVVYPQSPEFVMFGDEGRTRTPEKGILPNDDPVTPIIFHHDCTISTHSRVKSDTDTTASVVVGSDGCLSEGSSV